MNNKKQVPIISVVGWSNSGKTTFLEKLVAELKNRGYRVGIIKHHRGPFEIDQPGKDTWRLFKAGAACTAIAGPGKVGLVMETGGDMPPGEIAALMPAVDIIITEGYKKEGFPQIEIRRAGSGEKMPASREEQLVAVVGDEPHPAGQAPWFNLNDVQEVAKFIISNFIKQLS